MKKELNPEELSERAAAYALGSLDPDEVGSFAQLVAEDPAAAAELHAFREVVGALALDVPQVIPPTNLRQRLLSDLGPQDPQVEGATQSVPERWLVRAGEGDWSEMEPGVRIKVLFQDETRQTITTLVKMDAGARISHHYHEGAEECYVISGDIYDDRDSMKAGDYIALMRDTMHSFVATINGALLLIISPMGQVSS
jgi:quercetin dioxygenase-like cupin family protein